MSDEEHEINPAEYLADVATRLIEGDLLSGQTWRVAYTLGFVLDSLAEASQEDHRPDEVRALASDLIADIVNVLLYAHVHIIPGEQDIDTEAARFSAMFDKAEEIRKNINEKKEGE